MGIYAKVLTQDSRHSGASCNCGGLVATAYADPTIVVFAMNMGEESQPIAHSKFDRPITFRIEFNSRGLMTVSIGKTDPNQKFAVVAHPRRDVLEFTCSGADVSFLNIEAH
jgi:hypothetical protein